ncbi:MAG TPA: RNA polymerase sigma factor [Actinomycetota bacterium]
MDPATESDEALLAWVSEPGAFEELYRRHVAKVTAFATRRCARPHDVPDLVAAVWLEVIASSRSFDARKGRALPWVLGVAANLTASQARRRARELDALARLGREPLLEDEEVGELEARLDAEGPAREVLRALGELPAGERVVAELVFVEGLEPADVARALGIRPATARMRLLRARRKLRASIPSRKSAGDEPVPHLGGTS